MTMTITIRAHFLNGHRIERTYENCRDLPHALDLFQADASKPVNLGQYDITGITSRFEKNDADYDHDGTADYNELAAREHSADRKGLELLFASHKLADPHCTCNDCVSDHFGGQSC